MDEVLFGLFLRKTSLVVSLIGILVGLDLIFGAKVILGLKRILDRAYNLDKAISDPKARLWLGLAMFFISGVMLLLAVTSK